MDALKQNNFTVMILVKPFQEEGESYVDVLERKCPNFETAKYVVAQMEWYRYSCFAQ